MVEKPASWNSDATTDLASTLSPGEEEHALAADLVRI